MNRSVEAGSGRGAYLVGQRDWDLHDKGGPDQKRHEEKIRDAIRDQLEHIVSEEAIITSDGKTKVKVPIKSLELPRFRNKVNDQQGVGQGDGSGQPGVGDVISWDPDGLGKGKGAGNEPGSDYYEAEIDIDELSAILFENLGLPGLKPKGTQEIETDKITVKSRSKMGIMPLLDKKKTFIEALRRQAQHQEGKVDPKTVVITPEDHRFKTFEPVIRRETNAVIIAMRDVSGSMGEFEKFATRSFYFWMLRFLRTKYTSVNIVFITHHTEAQEVDEKTFFLLGESGGTKCSSAYEKTLEIIKERYDPSKWNIYPFHFSDGDNWGEDDNRKCVELVNQMLEISNLFGYIEVKEKSGWSSPTTLQKLYGEQINDPRFKSVQFEEKKDVKKALDAFFSLSQDTEGAERRV